VLIIVLAKRLQVDKPDGTGTRVGKGGGTERRN
jgi:hypothetical protein